MASNSDIKRTLGLINNINQTANLELKLQSLAKIKANLTTNESNLKAFKQLCGFKILCGLLKNNSNTKVINLVLSILANSAMKPDICKEIVTEHHVLADVSSILYNVEHPSIHCRAIRLVANVAKTSAYSKYVTRFPFLSRIVSVLSNTLSSDSIITCEWKKIVLAEYKYYVNPKNNFSMMESNSYFKKHNGLYLFFFYCLYGR